MRRGVWDLSLVLRDVFVNKEAKNYIYRIRVGDIRIVYLIDDGNKRIEVGEISRRSERTY